MSSLDDLFGELHDRAISGGCEMCDAYQTFETIEPGIHVIQIAHDDWCPVLRSMNAKAN